MQLEKKRKYKRDYAFAILTTAALIILNQIIIQYWLAQKKSDAAIINVSGKQRMLSQKILWLSYSDFDSPNPVKKEQLASTIQSWEIAHQKLAGKTNNNNLKIKDEEVRKELDELYSYIEVTKKYITQLNSTKEPQWEKLEENQSTYLGKMNALVQQLQKSSEKRLNLIVRIEIALALIALFVILLEYKLIFERFTGDLSKEIEKLAKSNDSLEQYAYIASHDLRTPLQNIINFSGLLTQEIRKEGNEKIITYTKFINDSTKRMQATTKDLLDFSTASHKELKREPTNIKTLFEDVLSDIKTLVEKSDAKVVANELPFKAHVDDTLFRQLMQNLISNAIKFVPEDRTPEVKFFAKKGKGKVTFCVSDNGIGVPDDSKEKIFGLYKRLHSQKEYKGTGIGLALCKKIVEKHEGNIWVEDNLENGSNFYFEIPENN